MAKLQPDIGSGVSVVAEVGATTAVRSRPSRKSAARPISKGPGPSKAKDSLSDQDLINIVMNGLNDLQERFGTFIFVPATEVGSLDRKFEDGEPLLLVLPKSLNACLKCGMIIKRTAQPYCEAHVPTPEAQPG